MASNLDNPSETPLELEYAPAKEEPGKMGRPCKFRTNASKITLSPNLTIYKYDVDINLIYETPQGEVRKKSLTKGPRNDCHSQYRSKYAKKALEEVFRNGVGIDKFFYDSHANLYSTCKLDHIQETLDPRTVIPNDADCKRVEVKITPVNESFQVCTNDPTITVNKQFGKADVTLLEALNTCISGSFRNERNIISYKGVHYFLNTARLPLGQNDLPSMPGSQYLGVGVSEAVKPYEVRDDKGTLTEEVALHCVVDMKKTAFHRDYVNLVDKFKELLSSNFNEPFRGNMSANDANARLLREKLKGLVVRLNYGRNENRGDCAQSLIIGGFGPSSSRSKFTNSKGEECTVASHFEKLLNNTPLQYPNLFTIYDNRKKNVYYPAEVLLIGENQRVTSQQLHAKGREVLVKSTAIPPIARERQIAALAGHIGLDGNNARLEATGINIAADKLLVDGRILPTPIIQSGDNPTPVVTNNSKWSSKQFLRPAVIPKWTFVAIQADINVDNFLQKLRSRIRETGMIWRDPRKINIRVGDEYSIDEIISNQKKDQTKFVFFVVRDKLDLHQEIKLMEQKHDLLTQEVRETVAIKINQISQKQTVENIVNKMNLKLGGCNWEVGEYNVRNLIKSNFVGAEHRRLILGFESSRGLSDNLACVGYSANASNHPQNFIGNFKYVKQHSDIFGQVFRPALYEMLRKYFEARQRTLPAHIYIYLNGISEGQYNLVAKTYSDKVKQVWKKLPIKPEKTPAITIMCVSKAPNERITNETTSAQNIPPGTCVDTGIVHPHVNEFFLNSHTAIQGTSRTPKFTHVYDDSKMEMDSHEGLAHQLTFLHGIVGLTTALPAPLVVADRYAKRGRANYQTYVKTDGRYAPDKQFDLNALNKLNNELSYTGKELLDVRFNA